MGHMASACRSTPQRGQQNQVMQSAESAEVAQQYPRGRGRGRGEFRGRGHVVRSERQRCENAATSRVHAQVFPVDPR
ncbi:hypothetical protein B566_EDAN014873 [Ephemera danica]|nr:hypothetical protein B566_EDAN014873 [Ephemera danica]